MRAALSAGRYRSIRLRPKPATSSAAFADIPSHVPGASRVHVGGARSARREILGHRLSRIRESLADRRHVGAEDGLALGTAPQVGARHGVEGALEARHHVAREELVALESVLTVRPLVGAEEDSAEAALRELDEALDALDHGVGRAHERGAGLDAVSDRIVRAAGRPAQRLLEVRHGLVALSRMYLA